MSEELKRKSEIGMLETAHYFFDEAASHLKLEGSLRTLLRYPKRKLIVIFPVVMDDGSVQHFEGFRVQHHLVLGPTKGGIRYIRGTRRAVTEPTVKKAYVTVKAGERIEQV